MLDYTKGEWKVSNGGISILGEDGFPIATCYPDTRVRSSESILRMKANAQLISGSPKMYELLKQLADWDTGKFGKDSSIKLIEISKRASQLIETDWAKKALAKADSKS